jgi:hypothetical protein
VPSAWHRTIPTFGVWVIVFASVVQWRQGEVFDGTLDPTVVAKAVVAVIGVLCAVALRSSTHERRQLSVFPTAIVLVIVSIALLGAQAAGSLEANLVLTVRILMLTFTVVTVVSVTPPRSAVTTMLAAMASIGLVAAVTGAASTHITGGPGDRLGGGIPPLQPNGLAALILPAAIGLVYFMVTRGVRLLPVVGTVVCAGILYETGSRTALAMLVVGGVIVVLCAKTVPRAIIVIALVGVLVAYMVLSFTGAFEAILLRGQDASQLGTLNSRTIAWDAILGTPTDSWAWWIGNGLSDKTVAVLGQYWTEQVFDSSWVSSLAQDGYLGTALLAVYVVGTVIATAVNKDVRGFALAQVVTTVIISFLENGLIESSTTFVLFLTFALISWPRPVFASGVSRDVSVPAEERVSRVLTYPAPLLRGPHTPDRDRSGPALATLADSGSGGL